MNARATLLREYAAALMADRAKEIDAGELHEAVDAFQGIDVGELADEEADQVAEMIREATVNVIIP